MDDNNPKQNLFNLIDCNKHGYKKCTEYSTMKELLLTIYLQLDIKLILILLVNKKLLDIDILYMNKYNICNSKIRDHLVVSQNVLKYSIYFALLLHHQE